MMIRRDSFHPCIRDNFKSDRGNEACSRERRQGRIFSVDTNDREVINNVTGQRGSCYVSGKRIVPITRTHTGLYSCVSGKRSAPTTTASTPRDLCANLFLSRLAEQPSTPLFLILLLRRACSRRGKWWA